MSDTVVLKVRKKGITVIPKRLREEASIEEESEVKARILREEGGILLQSLARDPVAKLSSLHLQKDRRPCQAYANYAEKWTANFFTTRNRRSSSL